MNATEIIDNIKNRKGQHVKVTWQRVAKTLHVSNLLVTKRTEAWVRAGIEFANIGKVIKAIEAGERGEVQELPWGRWFDYPFIIEHKGILYIRLYPSSFVNLATSVEWAINGRPTTYNDVACYLLASEKRKENDERPLCFTIKAESVISIDG